MRLGLGFIDTINVPIFEANLRKDNLFDCVGCVVCVCTRTPS